jgi:phytoene dehydrogenase-like protein
VEFDVIVIGAGLSGGLPAAAYLQKAALSPGQPLTGRPHPDCRGARTPIEGFYLGEGGAHPGIPGLLAAGAMAARAVSADHGFGGGS